MVGLRRRKTEGRLGEVCLRRGRCKEKETKRRWCSNEGKRKKALLGSKSPRHKKGEPVLGGEEGPKELPPAESKPEPKAKEGGGMYEVCDDESPPNPPKEPPPL